MKKCIGLFLLILIFGTSGGAYIAHADEDHHEYYEEHEKHDEKEHDHDEKEHDDDEEEYENNYDNGYSEDNTYTSEQGGWNIWTRSLVQNTDTLPIKKAKKATFKIDNKTLGFYIIPKNGELFVPAQKLTKALGGQSTYYETSKILITKIKDHQLIFRADTNVVYENMFKTPMSAKAFHFSKDIYVPVSVILNSFGYSIDWQEQQQQFICQTI
ncbi:stalk domain-containing protein [Rummeliibacillus sp. NPDC094406]|uniref:stalk domain-containing protein n=1 Tax=Rummeliibacillus sp. NPDC094406 TaxID=3364511 RepID=UPI0038085828